MSGMSFRYTRAANAADAVAQAAAPCSVFLAGGTDLMQLWKQGTLKANTLIDISQLPLNQISTDGGELVIGALARLSDVALNSDVVRNYPLVAQAISASACGQIRNMASVGGNLLQRTRCVYFRTDNVPCNKRVAGSGCGALVGENRQAALFGASDACVATHASDLAVALTALDAQIEILGPAGARRMSLDTLYVGAPNNPSRDSTLTNNELVTSVRISDGQQFADRSTYLKVRDRASFEFAVVSVAAALRIHDGLIVEARLAAGGVAPFPWRLPVSEAALIGQAPSAHVFAQAASLAIAGAKPLRHNAFKIDLLRNAIVRALQTVGVAP